jgi:hypothetical protein
MKTIVIEQAIYKVTDREFAVIKGMEKKVKDSATDYKACFKAEDELNEYLDVAKTLYKFVGTVDFHCQR